ncbi:peptide/nickel transport system permease protein [Devosia enhydra]|uniref:Peptide/nickel transport system permease protein n=1 Tax=Devosia enhydra TaxID=665118 RepID=A0A1K2HT76_9HYPH|nr:ABC transporter permease [Devosia enhydra]SFZ81241.1 peptide/nickel transport system permease protein [Devosia enhydra]
MYLDYVIRRFGVMVLVIFLAVTINFALPRLMPGDPIEAQLNQLMASGGGQMGDVAAMVEAYRSRFGLDQPVWMQYVAYWQSILRFDFGFSLANYPERVSHAIAASLPWTLGLLGFCTIVSFVIGTWLGGAIAWPRTPRWLRTAGSSLLILSAVPYFLIGMILLYVFAILVRWFPAGGGMPFGLNVGWNFETLRGILWHATLPAISIIIAEIGAWAIGMRGMLVSVLGEDYITLAEAKGNKNRRIFLRYGMRNALLPQLTKLALTLGHIVSGAILVEVIFSYPGLGFRLYQAIQTKDYFVIQGIVLLLSVSIAVAMFILDLIYPLIDPRITARKS